MRTALILLSAALTAVTAAAEQLDYPHDCKTVRRAVIRVAGQHGFALRSADGDLLLLRWTRGDVRSWSNVKDWIARYTPHRRTSLFDIFRVNGMTLTLDESPDRAHCTVEAQADFTAGDTNYTGTVYWLALTSNGAMEKHFLSVVTP